MEKGWLTYIDEGSTLVKQAGGRGKGDETAAAEPRNGETVTEPSAGGGVCVGGIRCVGGDKLG